MNLTESLVLFVDGSWTIRGVPADNKVVMQHEDHIAFFGYGGTGTDVESCLRCEREVPDSMLSLYRFTKWSMPR